MQAPLYMGHSSHPHRPGAATSLTSPRHPPGPAASSTSPWLHVASCSSLLDSSQYEILFRNASQSQSAQPWLVCGDGSILAHTVLGLGADWHDTACGTPALSIYRGIQHMRASSFIPAWALPWWDASIPLPPESATLNDLCPATCLGHLHLPALCPADHASPDRSTYAVGESTGCQAGTYQISHLDECLSAAVALKARWAGRRFSMDWPRGCYQCSESKCGIHSGVWFNYGPRAGIRPIEALDNNGGPGGAAYPAELVTDAPDDPIGQGGAPSQDASFGNVSDQVLQDLGRLVQNAITHGADIDGHRESVWTPELKPLCFVPSSARAVAAAAPLLPAPRAFSSAAAACAALALLACAAYLVLALRQRRIKRARLAAASMTGLEIPRDRLEYQAALLQTAPLSPLWLGDSAEQPPPHTFPLDATWLSLAAPASQASLGSLSPGAPFPGGLSASPPVKGADEAIPSDEIELRHVLGEGGMGIVYEGSWLGTTVAVKVLNRGSDPGEGACALLREARTLSQLHHPHVCRLFGATSVRGATAIVIECLSTSVAKLLQRASHLEETLDDGLLCRIACETAAGLAFLHRKGLMHRDVKPDNVLLDETLHAKVSDFGIAKLAGSEEAPSRCSEDGAPCSAEHTLAIGTPRYLAPETSKAAYDERCDVYSFGMLLWELSHQAAPFAGLRGMDAFSSALLGHRPPIQLLGEPRSQLGRLVEQCWQHDPKLRPHMEACHVLLQSLLHGLPVLPPSWEIVPPSWELVLRSSASPAAHAQHQPRPEPVGPPLRSCLVATGSHGERSRDRSRSRSGNGTGSSVTFAPLCAKDESMAAERASRLDDLIASSMVHACARHSTNSNSSANSSASSSSSSSSSSPHASAAKPAEGNDALPSPVLSLEPLGTSSPSAEGGEEAPSSIAATGIGAPPQLVEGPRALGLAALARAKVPALSLSVPPRGGLGRCGDLPSAESEKAQEALEHAFADPSPELAAARIEPSELFLLSTLGRGAFGTVHDARWQHPRESPGAHAPADEERSCRPLRAAVKKLHRKHVKPETLAACRRSICCELSLAPHPNVVRLLGWSLTPARCEVLLVMEHVCGGSLEAHIESGALARWAEAQLLLTTIGVARGVAFLHAQTPPLVHRDLKPANILLDAAGAPKVADFGCSRAMDGDTMTKFAIGTLLFTAPEQLQYGQYGTAVDVWALGCVLACLARCQLTPYDGSFSVSQVTSGERRPDVPEGHCLHEAIRACVREVSERATATAVVAMAERLACAQP